MKTLRRFVRLALFAALARSSLLAVPAEVEVNVNVDLTEDGRKVARPTRDHPVFYASLVGGFREKGGGLAGDPVPPSPPVVKKLELSLARQGYLAAGPQTPPPSLLLVLFWGRIQPELEDFGEAGVFLNRKEMMALVGSRALRNVEQQSAREAVLQAAGENRYFAVIAAYDYPAAQQKKKVLLWRTKMSTPTSGVGFADVASALIASGEPWLGRETVRPVWVTQPLASRGEVNLGELKVKEYIEPAAPGARKPGPP